MKIQAIYGGPAELFQNRNFREQYFKGYENISCNNTNIVNEKIIEN